MSNLVIKIERGVSVEVSRPITVVEIDAKGGLAEAPQDDTTYGRKNGAWVAVVSGAGGGITLEEADARYIRLTEKDAASGVAVLDASRKLIDDRLPEPPISLVLLFENGLI